MKHFSRITCWTVAFVLLGVITAHAQATRTWVSGVGDDANPCSRTAPCKTFAGAISKTAAGGDISVLDPGGFGAVTITKSITLDGNGVVASILAASSNGVTVNAAAGDIVILRNLSINGTTGATPGINGVRYLGGGALSIENCTLTGFTGAGVDVAVPAGATSALVIQNSTIADAGIGVNINPAAGVTRLDTTLRNVIIKNTGTAIDNALGFTNVTHSTITQNSDFGVLARSGNVNVENSSFTGNDAAVETRDTATVRLTNSGFYNNLKAFSCVGLGTLASSGDNRKGSNSGGAGPVCAPNAVVTLQ